jgi:hypothetical protein
VDDDDDDDDVSVAMEPFCSVDAKLLKKSSESSRLSLILPSMEIKQLQSQ